MAVDHFKQGYEVDTETSGGGDTLPVDPDYLKYAKLDALAVQWVLNTKIRSERHYLVLKQRMLDYLNHYLNRPRKRKSADQSNIPLTMAQEAVDAHHHSIMNRYERLRQMVRVKPPLLNPKEEQKRAARLIEAKLRLDDMMMNRWLIEDAITKSALIFGVGLASHQFHEILIRKEAFPGVVEGYFDEIPAYQGHIIDVIDPIDYYPAPEKAAMNDPYPDVTRKFITFEQLLAANENGAGYFDLDLIPDKRRSVPDYNNEERQQRKSVLGFSSDAADLRSGIEILEANCYFPIDKKDKEEDEIIYRPCVITLANNMLIGLKVNTNQSQSNMMTAAVIDKVPGNLIGISIIEKIHPLLHAGNVVLDLVLENIASTVHRMKGVIEEALVDPSELYSRPDGIVRFRRNMGRIDEVFRELESRPLGAEVFRLLDFFMTGGEHAGFATAVFKGSGAEGIETATESRDLATFSSEHNQYFLHMLQQSHIEPSHRLGLEINADFCDFPIIFTLGGELSSEWLTITDRRDLNYLYQIKGTASNEERERISTIQQTMQLLEIVKGHPALETMLPYTVNKLVELFNWDDIEDVKKRVDIGWQQYVMQMKMGMSQQMGQSQNSGLVVPGRTGGQTRPGQITSRPQAMSRATNPAEITRMQAESVRPGTANVGRR